MKVKPIPLLIGLSGVALVIGGTIQMAKDWWVAHGYELRAEVREAYRQGVLHGRQGDKNTCRHDALALGRENSGFLASVSNASFLEGCLSSSRATPGFCHNVPPRKDFIKTVLWAEEICEQADWADLKNCSRLLGRVQSHCHPAVSSAAGS